MVVLGVGEGPHSGVGRAKEPGGGQMVTGPGSLNLNRLHTRDPDGARSFYGSVFGWEALGLPGGAQMWRLPGYGDFLGQGEPGPRTRMGGGSAPEGFEDVGAALHPIAGDQADVAPHRRVTLRADDADATAATAR